MNTSLGPKGVSFLLASSILLTTAHGKDPVYGTNGMVVVQEPFADAAGLRVLKDGGNAVDAAVAVGFALAVTYPYAGNIGGGGFMTIRMVDGRAKFIDFREKAPGGASHDMYLDAAAGHASTVGWRAVGVPGTVRGLELAFAHYGSRNKSWAELIQPALSLATNGFPVSASTVTLFKGSGGKLTNDPESKRIFFTNGDCYGEGAILRQQDLGLTLSRIVADPNDFYTGKTAEILADAMAANGGLITLDDLRAYHAVERTPLEGDYHGFHIITAPPPSSGGICILEMLGMLDATGFANEVPGSAHSYHYLAEVMRRAFADRMEYLGDPDFMMPPLSALNRRRQAGRIAKLRRNGHHALQHY
jgi:gamma-glutamyltranspeptidase/glutathione hydrolase